jgi:hypothetical protein
MVPVCKHKQFKDLIFKCDPFSKYTMFKIHNTSKAGRYFYTTEALRLDPDFNERITKLYEILKPTQWKPTKVLTEKLVYL